jgi:hypothetical protein
LRGGCCGPGPVAYCTCRHDLTSIGGTTNLLSVKVVCMAVCDTL